VNGSFLAMNGSILAMNVFWGSKKHTKQEVPTGKKRRKKAVFKQKRELKIEN
jgi:hypothetical protein